MFCVSVRSLPCNIRNSVPSFFIESQKNVKCNLKCGNLKQSDLWCWGIHVILCRNSIQDRHTAISVIFHLLFILALWNIKWQKLEKKRMENLWRNIRSSSLEYFVKYRSLIAFGVMCNICLFCCISTIHELRFCPTFNLPASIFSAACKFGKQMGREWAI